MQLKYQDFFTLFPRYPLLRGGANIVGRSKGEIDYVTSMTMQRIIIEQDKTIKANMSIILVFIIAYTYPLLYQVHYLHHYYSNYFGQCQNSQ